MPDSLQEVTIDYPTGLRAGAECSDDLVTLPVPPGTNPPLKPGCSGPSFGTTLRSTVQNAVQRAGKWLGGLVH